MYFYIALQLIKVYCLTLEMYRSIVKIKLLFFNLWCIDTSPEISDFNLNTDQRVNQREVFDQHIKAREAELEGLKRQREERNDRERGEEVARMRQAAVHQAQGIKKWVESMTWLGKKM